MAGDPWAPRPYSQKSNLSDGAEVVPALEIIQADMVQCPLCLG